ncbi:MAG: LysR family transcriptional regulator [Rhizobiaceae bacterium]
MLTPYTIRELTAFRALIIEGTTSAAAKRCEVSQSSISRSIASLQKKMETQLFDRVGGRFSPTPDARRLNERLDDLFASLVDVEAIDWSERLSNNLSIVTTPAFSRTLLTPAITSFCKRYPDVYITLDVQRKKHILETMNSGEGSEYDLGVVWTASIGDKYFYMEYFRKAHVCAITLPDHPLAGKSTIKVEDLNDVPLIGNGHKSFTYRYLDQKMESRGISRRWVMNYETNDCVIDAVVQGGGVAISPNFPFDPISRAKVEFIKLDPPMERFAAFASPVEQRISPLTAEFKNHIVEVADTHPFAEPID